MNALSPDPDRAAMTDDAASLRAHADRVRASGVLGRSPQMQRLFEFLLDSSIAGKAPKEIEVAVDAFGKGADFDASQDAMVRVYIYKLRRKLEEFYTRAGASEPVRLSIPKGEYRFVVETVAIPGSALEQEELAIPPATPQRRWLLPVLAISAVLNIIVLALVFLRSPQPRDDLTAVRANTIWAPLLKDDRPIFVVVGDYYIFGETDDSMEVKRLVREFGINSPQDLQNYLKLNPQFADRYMDLELGYLPTAIAYALRDLMPVLEPANKRLRIVTMSQLSPALLKSSDVIYVGYLSGLGMLSDYVFTNSRLAVGDSFDEIIDRTTKKRYVSQETRASIRGARTFHDYGYFATFAGPSGNHIVVIAGTRDVAAMHIAETLTTPNGLRTLAASAAKTPAFEALYEVYGMNRLNIDGKLLLTSPLDGTTKWTGGRGERPSVAPSPAAEPLPP